MGLHGLHGKMGCCGYPDDDDDGGGGEETKPNLPYVLAKKTLYASGSIIVIPNLTWKLEQYQGPGIIANPEIYYRWRIIDTYYSDRLIYGRDYISGDGELVDLPDTVRAINDEPPGYSFNAIMEIQIGCNDNNGKITWPWPG
jgi:hypothetical protein